MPPSLTVAEINATEGPAKDADWPGAPRKVRELFPDATTDGYAQTDPVGNVSAPTLFVCGSEDQALLCSLPEMRSLEYCPTGSTYKEVACGHNLLDCYDVTERNEVLSSIIAHIDANKLALGRFNI